MVVQTERKRKQFNLSECVNLETDWFHFWTAVIIITTNDSNIDYLSFLCLNRLHFADYTFFHHFIYISQALLSNLAISYRSSISIWNQLVEQSYWYPNWKPWSWLSNCKNNRFYCSTLFWVKIYIYMSRVQNKTILQTSSGN